MCKSKLAAAPARDRAKRFARRGKFRFMDLPPEIRNMIYFSALSNEEDLRKTRRKTHHKPPGDKVFPLLRVSKTIHQESLALFYANVTKPFPIAIINGRLSLMTKTKLWALSTTAVTSLRRLEYAFTLRDANNKLIRLIKVKVDLAAMTWEIIDDHDHTARIFRRNEYSSFKAAGESAPGDCVKALIQTTFVAGGEIKVTEHRVRKFAKLVEPVAPRFLAEKVQIG